MNDMPKTVQTPSGAIPKRLMREGIDLLINVLDQEKENPNYSGGLSISSGFIEFEGDIV